VINLEEVLRVEGISKEFPGVFALKNVFFNLYKGEVHALVGENGAGKSTLIKILTGALTPTKGKIVIFGKEYDKLDPILTLLSQDIGIAAVYQELFLANYLNVVDNVLLGIEPSKLGFVSMRGKKEKVFELLKSIRYTDLRVDLKVKDLSVAQQGIVAILKVMSRNAKIIIFDEPTASLGSRESAVLFEVIDKLRKSGVSIIYISHRLEEVFKIADRVSVLKDGQLVGEAKIGEVDMNKLISLMVGRKIDSNLYDSSRKIGKEIFRCEGIKNTKVRNISFSVHAGEIVGMYGLVGSGRTEVARAIFGADKIFSGRIFIKGKQVKIKSPVFAKKSLLSYLPDDRRNLGLAMQLSVMNNINLASYENISRFGFVDLKKERFVVGNLIKALSIKTPSMFQIVSKLSGGNQQKVVISRWLAARSDIFLMDEPTIGIDVGAKNEMYKLINNLARQGKGIIFISSHMPELIAICDRIIVMKEGQIAGEIKRQNFYEEKILKMAIENRKVEDINV
jgi:ribose transport system ATP-binding protein